MTGKKIHDKDPIGSPETFVYPPSGHYLMVYSGPLDRYQRTEWGPGMKLCVLQQFSLMTRLKIDLESDDQNDDDYEYTEWALAVMAFPDDPR